MEKKKILTHNFSFDKIFGPNSSQIEVFDFAAKPVIRGVLDGFNGTILCYGETNSGKTHTMEVNKLIKKIKNYL